MWRKLIYLILLGFMSSHVSYGENTDYPTLNEDWSYCFEYTWLGPQYDNQTTYNGTCDDYKDDTRAGDDIPCAPPIVISYDGSIPDVEYLWNNHRASVLCKRSETQACVTYTYWYNGLSKSYLKITACLVTNRTHMCARVMTGSTSTPTACYKEKNNGYEVELCICKSGFGLSSMPCNSGASSYAAMLGIVFLTSVLRWML